jgi:Xaa-Pro dipeptidase
MTDIWKNVIRDPAFDKAELMKRVLEVQKGMRERGFDLLLVSDFSNIYYLSGLDSIAQHDFLCVVVPADGEPTVAINEFYEGIYHHVAGAFPTLPYNEFQDPVAVIMEGARALAPGAGVVGFDNAWPAMSGRIAAGLQSALPGAVLKDSFGVVESARVVKTETELSHIRKAAELTEAGVTAAMTKLAPGCVDREVAAEAISAMYRAGSDSVPLGPIVCGGYSGGVPYSSFSGYTLRQGDSIFIELTGSVRRYTAPLMRTFVLGKPDREVDEAARATSRAVDAILATARDGVSAKEVANAALGELSAALSGKLFHNIIAYPVGIAYPPTWVEKLGYTIKADANFTLRSGMVFHLPMSLRKLGSWAMGLSQTIVVGPDKASALTTSPSRVQIL